MVEGSVIRDGTVDGNRLACISDRQANRTVERPVASGVSVEPTHVEPVELILRAELISNLE